MAITITPKQQKILIDALNKSYADHKKEKGNIRIGELPDDLKTPPLEKLLEKEAGNKEFLKRVEDLRAQYGEEKTDQILRRFVNYGDHYGEEGDHKKPAPDAFYTAQAPAEREDPVTAYHWNYEDKGGPKEDSEEILKRMSPEEREWFMKKLNFPCVWTNPGKGEIGLYGKYPVNKKFFNARFAMDKFMDQGGKLVERTSKRGLVDKEKLVEDLAELISEKAQQEEQYREDEDGILESEGDYTAEDAKHKSWQDLTQNLNDNVMRYVNILKEKDVSERDIRDMLIEAGDNEVSHSHHTTDNAIGSQSVSSEHEVYIEEIDDWMDDPKWPYPGDFDANLALLNEADIKNLEKSISSGSPRFRWSKENDQFELNSLTVYTSDSTSVELVVDPKKFILETSRFLKDLKIKKKHELGASVEGQLKFIPELEAAIMQLPVFKLLEEWDRFPATGSVMRKAMPEISDRFPALTKVLKKT